MLRYIGVFLFSALFLIACSTPNDFKAQVNYIRHDFKPNSYLNKNQVDFIRSLDSKTVLIKDVNEASFVPSLAKNGFQIADFRSDNGVLNLLSSIKNATSEAEREAALDRAVSAFENSIHGWGKTNLSSTFDTVVCARGFYRNTNFFKQYQNQAHPHFELPHIDFYPGQDLHNLFTIVGVNDAVKRKLGDASVDENFWKENKLVKMLNFWMPFATVEAYPLAVLDKASMNFDDVIPNLSFVRGIPGEFNSGALRYREGQQFYYKSRITRGEAMVFETFGTPHTAVSLPGQKGDRESYDIRCAFIRMNDAS